MVKLPQALVLDPPTELVFQAPFKDVTAYLDLYNPTEYDICFKLKTTAPRTYWVRPNSGIIKPKKKVRVSVILQTSEFDLSEVVKHKFMVQTLYAPEGEFDLDGLWRDTPPEKMMNSKIRCVFEHIHSEPAKMEENKSEEKEKDLESAVEGSVTPSTLYSKPEMPSKEEDEKAQEYLRTTIAQLKKENSHLKEENLIHRVRANASAIAESKVYQSPPVNKAVVEEEQSFAFFLVKHVYVVCFIILIIGICLGHFLL